MAEPTNQKYFNKQYRFLKSFPSGQDLGEAQIFNGVCRKVRKFVVIFLINSIFEVFFVYLHS